MYCTYSSPVAWLWITVTLAWRGKCERPGCETQPIAGISMIIEKQEACTQACRRRWSVGYTSPRLDCAVQFIVQYRQSQTVPPSHHPRPSSYLDPISPEPAPPVARHGPASFAPRGKCERDPVSVLMSADRGDRRAGSHGDGINSVLPCLALTALACSGRAPTIRASDRF